MVTSRAEAECLICIRSICCVSGANNWVCPSPGLLMREQRFAKA